MANIDNTCINEEWRSVVGYEGLYEISNKGRLRSVDRIIKFSRNGITFDLKRKCHIMALRVTKQGYLGTSIGRSGIKETISIHRLVAIAFLAKPYNDCSQVNHIDGNKLNNTAINLEWVSAQQNICHAISIGISNPGSRQAKPVRGTCKETGCKKEFKSISDAARYFCKANRAGDIHRAILNGYIAYGHYWEYQVA